MIRGTLRIIENVGCLKSNESGGTGGCQTLQESGQTGTSVYGLEETLIDFPPLPPPQRLETAIRLQRCCRLLEGVGGVEAQCLDSGDYRVALSAAEILWDLQEQDACLLGNGDQEADERLESGT